MGWTYVLNRQQSNAVPTMVYLDETGCEVRDSGPCLHRPKGCSVSSVRLGDFFLNRLSVPLPVFKASIAHAVEDVGGSLTAGIIRASFLVLVLSRPFFQLRNRQ